LTLTYPFSRIPLGHYRPEHRSSPFPQSRHSREETTRNYHEYFLSMPSCRPSPLTVASAHPLTDGARSTNPPLLSTHRLFSLMKSRPDRPCFCLIVLFVCGLPSKQALLQLGEYRMCSTVNPLSWACRHFLRIPMPSIVLLFVCTLSSLCTFPLNFIFFRVYHTSTA